MKIADQSQANAILVSIFWTPALFCHDDVKEFWSASRCQISQKLLAIDACNGWYLLPDFHTLGTGSAFWDFTVRQGSSATRLLAFTMLCLKYGSCLSRFFNLLRSILYYQALKCIRSKLPTSSSLIRSEVYITLLPRSIWSKPLATSESAVDSWLSRDLWLGINNGKWVATLNTDLSCMNLCKSLNDIILVWWSLMITLLSCSGIIHLQYHEQKTDLLTRIWWFVHTFVVPAESLPNNIINMDRLCTRGLGLLLAQTPYSLSPVLCQCFCYSEIGIPNNLLTKSDVRFRFTWECLKVRQSI